MNDTIFIQNKHKPKEVVKVYSEKVYPSRSINFGVWLDFNTQKFYPDYDWEIVQEEDVTHQLRSNFVKTLGHNVTGYYSYFDNNGHVLYLNSQYKAEYIDVNGKVYMKIKREL